MASAHPATVGRAPLGLRLGPTPALVGLVLVLALPAVFVAPAALPGSGTWWPAAGMLAAALLLSTSRARWGLHALAALVCTPCIMAAYDTTVAGGLVSSLAVLLPAEVAAVGLRPTPEQRVATGPVRDFAGVRYHLVVVVAGLVCGALAAVLSLTTTSPLGAALWSLSTSVGGLTSMLLVLPLIAGTGGAPATGHDVELWSQRALVAAMVVALFVGGTGAAALATAAFPLLGWAALRSTRRETHLQVCAVGIAAYVSTTHSYATGDVDPLGLPGPLSMLPLFFFLASLSLFTVPLALAAERLSQARADAVRSADTLVRMLESASSTMFVITDSAGRLTQFNEGARRLLGYAPERVVGQSSAMFHTEAEVSRHAEALGVPADLRSVILRQVELGEPRDWSFVTADGSERVVSLSISAITDPGGGVVGYLGAGTDVTERERSQHVLEAALDREHESVRRLREVDDVKQELISTVSHELRTPITSIAGYAELLSDSSLGDLTRQQRDALQRIERNAVRLQTLVDDLLTLSRSESGRLQLHRVPLDLRQVVRSAWELFEAQLGQRRLSTSLVLPPDPVMVVGDENALERVVVNLVSNAVKFTPDGGAVTLALTSDSGTARLLVRDTGIGIDPADQEKLFTRFFRAREATDQAIQGTGLGLSIVQALVGQHGGHVAVRSHPGAGTRVTVDLPTG